MLVFVAAVALIVLGSGSSDESPKGKATTAEQRTATTKARASSTGGPRRRDLYTVKPGDTLGGIGQKTGVRVETLLQLNPSLDPQALVSGQKIKLRQ